MTAYELIEALFKGPHEGGPMDWLEKEIRLDTDASWPTVLVVDEKNGCIVLRTKPFDPGAVR